MILTIHKDYHLQNEHKHLPFLRQKIKINKQTKLTANFYDKTIYVVYVKLLQHALNHRLKFKKVHRVIEFELSA